MPTAIVTGASRGLGLELARSLAADGWRVVVDGRDPVALRDAAARIGGDVVPVAGDVAHRIHRRELVEAIAQPAGEPPPQLLTPREREVLELIGRGYANKRIALELGLSEKTVKTHVSHLLAKLGVRDRTQAAVHAVRAGMIGRKT